MGQTGVAPPGRRLSKQLPRRHAPEEFHGIVWQATERTQVPSELAAHSIFTVIQSNRTRNATAELAAQFPQQGHQRLFATTPANANDPNLRVFCMKPCRPPERGRLKPTPFSFFPDRTAPTADERDSVRRRWEVSSRR